MSKKKQKPSPEPAPEATDEKVDLSATILKLNDQIVALNGQVVEQQEVIESTALELRDLEKKLAASERDVERVGRIHPLATGSYNGTRRYEFRGKAGLLACEMPAAFEFTMGMQRGTLSPAFVQMMKHVIHKYFPNLRASAARLFTEGQIAAVPKIVGTIPVDFRRQYDASLRFMDVLETMAYHFGGRGEEAEKLNGVVSGSSS